MKWYRVKFGPQEAMGWMKGTDLEIDKKRDMAALRKKADNTTKFHKSIKEGMKKLPNVHLNDAKKAKLLKLVQLHKTSFKEDTYIGVADRAKDAKYFAYVHYKDGEFSVVGDYGLKISPGDRSHYPGRGFKQGWYSSLGLYPMASNHIVRGDGSAGYGPAGTGAMAIARAARPQVRGKSAEDGTLGNLRPLGYMGHRGYLGSPSHGCIRFPQESIDWVYENGLLDQNGVSNQLLVVDSSGKTDYDSDVDFLKTLKNDPTLSQHYNKEYKYTGQTIPPKS